MSSQWDFDDDNERDTNSDGGKPKGGMREYIKQLQAENAQLKTELAEANQKARQAALSHVMAEKKLPPKVAKLLPPDIDPTTEAIDKWLEEYGEVFNLKPADNTPEETDQGEPADSMEEQGYRQQMDQVSRMSNGSIPPAKEKDLLAKLSSRDLSRDDLVALITQQGGGFGSG